MDDISIPRLPKTPMITNMTNLDLHNSVQNSAKDISVSKPPRNNQAGRDESMRERFRRTAKNKVSITQYAFKVDKQAG